MGLSNNLVSEGAASAPVHSDRVEDSCLLTALMEVSNERIYFKDLESRFVHISRTQAQLFGLANPGEAIGKTDREFFGERHAENARRDELEIMRSGQPVLDKEEREDWPDGRVTWSSSSKMPLFNAAGTCIGTFGISRDITRRKEAEEALLLKNALLEAQAETTIDGILVVDEADRVILSNKQFRLHLGIPEELVSAGDDNALLEFVVGKMENPRAFIERVNYLYSHRSEKSMDEIRFKTGQIFDRYSAPLVDSRNQYRGRIWYFRDITERKRTEDVLRRLSLVVEQSPVAVVITNLNGEITYVNQKFTESSGYLAEDVLGKTPRVLKSGHTSPEDYGKLWKTITSGGEWRGMFQNRKKNGDLYWESAVIRPLEDHDGTVTHFLALKEDVTEKLAMESQLRQSQKLEAIGQLAAGIAHEINTPIQYIGDNTSFLSESWGHLSCLLTSALQLRDEVPAGAVSPTTLEQFDRCRQAADVEYLSRDIPAAIDQTLDGVQRVAGIVRAMKEFSHPGSQEKGAVDLNKAIETTITISRNEWKYVANVETQLEPELPMVPCLAGEMNQVLLNLVVNAAHAIADVLRRDGGSMGTITFSTRRDGNWVEVSVADTGTGIPEHVRERVFDPFFTTKEIGKGTGQGLMLAYAVVVKKHGGKIWFVSEIGQGTTFFVRLPLLVAQEESIAETHPLC